MADIEPPSFSLGLDFDSDSDPDPTPNPPPPIPPTRKTPGSIESEQKGKQRVSEIEDDVEFPLRVSDSEPDSPDLATRTRFRRLRRGVPSLAKAVTSPISNSVDEDIEDFSEDENARINDRLEPHHSSCSSSKLPLTGCGVLMRQPESAICNRKGKQDSNCPTSLGSSKGKTVFSDLTASPLRRFQLLDSESDPDDPSDVHIDREPTGVNFSENSKQKEYNIQERFKLLDSESDHDDASEDERIDKESNHCTENIIQKESRHGNRIMSLGKKTDLLHPSSQNQDLWKDFCVTAKCSVQTPVFDEFLKEHFQSVNSSKPYPLSHKLCSSEQAISMNDARQILRHQDSGSVVPPSHCYFFHNDLRIQKLVCSRLPHFFPLTSTDAGSKSHNVSSIDYMSQFGQDGGNRQTGRQVSLDKSSRRGKKKSKNSNLEEASGSGDWINPKQTASSPKDAGRRRVHADGQSAGQWITENGRKVYVTKNGQELTGRVAYIHYRKESGRSFKKSKKKSAAKKK